MIFDGDIVIREILLPPGVHGAIRESPDGIINVYINQSDSEEEKKKTLRHEMAHYRLGHLNFNKPVSIMEAEANRSI